MKFQLMILVIFLFTSAAHSQIPEETQNRLDTLSIIIRNSPHDTITAQTYFNVGNLLYKFDIDSVLKISEFVHQLALTNLQSNSLNPEEKIAFKEILSHTYNDLGHLNRKRGKINLAIDYYNKCIDLSTELNNQKALGHAYNNLGNLYARIEDAVSAIPLLEKSIEIRQNLNEEKYLAKSYNNLSQLYQEMGNDKAALEYLNKSLELRIKTKDIAGEATTYNNLGSLSNATLDYESAKTFFLKAITIRQNINQREGLATSYNNLGKTYIRFNQMDSAWHYISKSYEIRSALDNKEAIGGSLYSIGLYYYCLNQYEEAIGFLLKCYNNSISIQNPYELKSSLLLLSFCYEKIGTNDELDRVLSKLIDIADQSLKSNFNILSEDKREMYFKESLIYFDRLYAYIHKFGSENKELFYKGIDLLIQNKGQQLKSTSALKLHITSVSDTSLATTYDEWIKTNKHIAKNYFDSDKLAIVNKKKDSLETILVRYSNFFDKYYKNISQTWKSSASLLGDNEAIIEFVHFNDFRLNLKGVLKDSIENVYGAYILKANSEPVYIPLFKESELANILTWNTANNQAFADHCYGTKEDLNTELFSLIWQPLSKHLGKVRNVYISPSGLLFKISFSAISTPKGNNLCQTYNLYNFSDYNAFSENYDSTISSALVFGGVSFGESNSSVWTYLEGTLKESTEIHNILETKGIRSQLFQEQQATESNFITNSQSSDLLHIATHGFFFEDPSLAEINKEENTSYGEVEFRNSNLTIGIGKFLYSKNPLKRSGIVLANANTFLDSTISTSLDGILTASEVSILDLSNVQLVVLSACETGLGSINGFEGVYGLQRAFKMAGAKHLIMSLWQVPDKETEEFMIMFYEHLVKYNDVKKAFSKTQLKMSKKYDPFYWGAFILIL